MQNRQDCGDLGVHAREPGLPGPEVVEAPIWARKHRRFHHEGCPKANAVFCPKCRDGCTNPTGHHELSQRIAALNGLTAQQLRIFSACAA